MELLFVTVFVFYLALVVLLVIGWEKARVPQRISIQAGKSKISVIVAVRDEANNIERLMQQLRDLKEPNVEIIIVDDHSTDETVALIQDQHSNIRLIKNPGNGKKSALTAGIEQATGDIIATTDADCDVPENWLRSVNMSFQNPVVKLSFGAVRIKTNESLFSKLQAIEFSSLIGSGAGLAALGKPIMCNGANLAYRRDVFFEVNGFEGNLDVASGDDEFLMRKICQKYPHGIFFDNAADRIVTTEPANTVRTFIQQRIRWAAKWKRNTSFVAILVALFMVLVQAATIGLWIFAILDSNVSILLLLLVKLIIEGVFLFRVCRFLNVEWNIISFVILQFIYPFYVLCIGVLANFLSFEWKGRKEGRTFQVARRMGGFERSKH